jgi:hypothetical protein
LHTVGAVDARRRDADKKIVGTLAGRRPLDQIENVIRSGPTYPYCTQSRLFLTKLRSPYLKPLATPAGK